MSSLLGFFILLYVDLCMPLVGPKLEKIKFLILDSCKLQKGCTRLATASDKVYQLLAQGRWFSPGTPASSNTKTGRHDIAEILLIVTLNTKIQILNSNSSNFQMNQFSTLWPLRICILLLDRVTLL